MSKKQVITEGLPYCFIYRLFDRNVIDLNLII